jgi:hypothetical protein
MLYCVQARLSTARAQSLITPVRSGNLIPLWPGRSNPTPTGPVAGCSVCQMALPAGD